MDIIVVLDFLNLREDALVLQRALLGDELIPESDNTQYAF